MVTYHKTKFLKVPLDWANECVDSSPSMKPTRNQIACTVRDALQSQHEYFIQLVKGTLGHSQETARILEQLGNTPKS